LVIGLHVVGCDGSHSEADHVGSDAGSNLDSGVGPNGDGSDARGDVDPGARPDGSPDAGGVETHCDEVGPEVTFCDDFNGTELDTSRWWYGRRHWGPLPPLNDGVVPENISVHDGRAFFAARGDAYTGPVRGIRGEMVAGETVYVQDQPGARSGGIIVSDAYLGSGRYEAKLRLPPKTGVATAMWTFHYQEVYQGDPLYQPYVDKGNVPQGNASDGFYVIVNHEIDIEVPTSLMGQPDTSASYRNARFNTWIGESNAEYTPVFLDTGRDYSDGNDHIYRFDWHAGGGGIDPRVDFYFDGSLQYTSTTHIPWIKGRLTIGTWFPQWAGKSATFDVASLEVDWISFAPFDEPNDRTVRETYPDDGLTKCHEKVDNDANLPQCRIVGR
jgi:hypothetical protein